MTHNPPAGVRTDVSLNLVVPEGAALPVRARLEYDPADPYAVQVIFRAQPAVDGTDDGAGAPGVSWSFARDLLLDGLTEPTGMGDVRVWPWRTGNDPVVAMALTSPDGHALFTVSRRDLRDFVARTFAVVPRGEERSYLDVDAALAELLGQPGR
jgi:hypothetical protein